MSISRKNIFFIVLCFTCAVAFSLLAVRIFMTGRDGYIFLLWNLFLAWIPYALSLFFDKRRRISFESSSLFVAWLFFFPNAPYIVTDFIHLPWSYMWTASFWYDFAMIGTFSLAGIFLGVASLFYAHRFLERVLGTVFSHFVIVFIVVLSGIGIYIGRFLRWNSWDVLVNPRELFSEMIFFFIGNPESFGGALVLSTFFATFVGISYGIFLFLYRLLGSSDKKM